MVDVVSDQVEVSYAESVTGWSGDSFTLDTEILVQGNNSVSCIQTSNGVNDAIYTGGPWNMANKHIRLYMLSNIVANMTSGSAVQVLLGDGTNTAIFTVFTTGADYGGGWKDIFFDVESTPLSGTVNTAAITSVTLRINTSTKPRNAINGWYDNWRFGNGLEINSTTTEAFDFADVAANDALVANKYDIIEDIDETLFAKGTLTLGNAAGAKNCNLVSLNEDITFINRVVSSTLYAIVTTQGTGWTDVDIEGGSIKTNGVSGAELDFTDTRNLRIVGKSFANMGSMLFANGSVSTEVNTSKFTSCGTTNIAAAMNQDDMTWILSKTITLLGTLTRPIIKNCIDAASITTASLNNIVDGQLTSDGSNHAVELTGAAATYNWDCVVTNYDAGVTGTGVQVTGASITGNEAIHITATTGTFIINVETGATIPSVSSAGAIVNVVAGQVTLTISAQVSLVGAEIAIYDMDLTPPDFGTELQHVESALTATYAYSGTIANLIRVQVMLDGYEEFSQTTTMPTVSGTFDIQLTPETN